MTREQAAKALTQGKKISLPLLNIRGHRYLYLDKGIIYWEKGSEWGWFDENGKCSINAFLKRATEEGWYIYGQVTYEPKYIYFKLED